MMQTGSPSERDDVKTEPGVRQAYPGINQNPVKNTRVQRAGVVTAFCAGRRRFAPELARHERGR